MLCILIACQEKALPKLYAQHFCTGQHLRGYLLGVMETFTTSTVLKYCRCNQSMYS